MSSSNNQDRLAELLSLDVTVDGLRVLAEYVVTAYGALVDAEGESVSILSAGHQVTATDAARAASALLSAVNLEVFELAMWENFGGRPGALPPTVRIPDRKVDNSRG
ncbi:hypothetical protein [Kutzneria sp. NPDC052558]|uniref:hypothetical protein n=1 Tax=Kutzneria sp. NPDC052558 TaxID=3364121 RepID=UPI0037CBFB03